MAPMEKQILEHLNRALSPQEGKVAGIVVDGGKVMVSVEVDPLAKNLDALQKKLEAAVKKISGVESVTVVLTAEKKAPAMPQLKEAPNPNRPIHQISSRSVAPRVKHIIAVASGKGGVGKSTIAANLALAFVAMGKKTGLLDADIYGASQPRMLGLRARPETNKDDMIVPPVAHGMKVMSMGFFVAETAPVVWRGPMVHSAIQQLFRDVAWGDLDILVVDMPPGTGDAQLSLAQYVPLSGAVIISTPQDVALSEARKGLAMFEKVNVPILGLIENMSYHQCLNCGHREDIFDHGGVGRAATELGVAFLGEIPLQGDLRKAADAGTPLVASAPHHPISEKFKDIAGRIWAGLPLEKTVPKAPKRA